VAKGDTKKNRLRTTVVENKNNLMLQSAGYLTRNQLIIITRAFETDIIYLFSKMKSVADKNKFQRIGNTSVKKEKKSLKLNIW